MDYKGPEGTLEALEEQKSRYKDFSDAKAHARCSQTKGPAARNLNRSLRTFWRWKSRINSRNKKRGEASPRPEEDPAR